jgi:basic membrane lipoprotein Med (substrate-binding protein (PBP1-ABC) superfamily)
VRAPERALRAAARSTTARAKTARATLLALGLLVACGSGPDAASDRKSDGASAADAFRVALLTPGSIRDAGWNQGAYEGLKRIESELGAQIGHQETRTPQDFEAGFRDFAARDFRLVFGHGFEFQDAAAKVGAEYPDTVFVTTSGSTLRENVAPIVFELEQATYVLGFVGASISKTGKLGAVGGIEIPSVASTFLAFEAGAKAARPDVEVSISYVGSWEDVTAAREATLALIAWGADVLIHNADAAGRGVFQAVQEADGALAFGTNKNQNQLAPDHVLASATLDIPTALLLVAREVQQGEFVQRSIRFGLRGRVVAVEWNDALADRVPDSVRARAEGLVRRIEAGELEVPRAGF